MGREATPNVWAGQSDEATKKADGERQKSPKPGRTRKHVGLKKAKKSSLGEKNVSQCFELDEAEENRVILPHILKVGRLMEQYQ